MPSTNPVDTSKVPHKHTGRLSMHPWIWAKELAEPAFLGRNPCIVAQHGHWYLYSPKSQIRLRRWMTCEQSKANVIRSYPEFDREIAENLSTNLQTLWSSKKSVVSGDECFRWVFSDNDDFPGLIIDVYGSTLVCQILTAPVDFFWISIRRVLEHSLSVLAPEVKFQLLEDRSSTIRELEGLSILEPPETSETTRFWNGLHWIFRGPQGQKTGLYLDQRENHCRAAELAAEQKASSAWDIFSYMGGFALHLAKKGVEVLAVDQSSSALEAVTKNAELNQLSKYISTTKQDGFEFIREAATAGKKVDCISLDPPAISPKERNKPQALRACQNLLSSAFHCLNLGGLLVFSTCSHHLGRRELEKIVTQAAAQAKCQIRILEVRGPAADHAPKLGFPEGNYLHCFFIELLGSTQSALASA